MPFSGDISCPDNSCPYLPARFHATLLSISAHFFYIFSFLPLFANMNQPALLQLLMNPVGNGNHRPPVRSPAQYIQNPFFRHAVQICRNLIQQHNLWLCHNSPCNGVSYPFGRSWTFSCKPTSFITSSTSAREMVSSNSVICSATVPITGRNCCSTQPIKLRRSFPGIRSASTPPIVTFP